MRRAKAELELANILFLEQGNPLAQLGRRRHSARSLQGVEGERDGVVGRQRRPCSHSSANAASSSWVRIVASVSSFILATHGSSPPISSRRASKHEMSRAATPLFPRR